MSQTNSQSVDEGEIESLDSTWTFGFVMATVLEDLGFCGGYLLLNGFGHPCEFHCSLPLKPSRTQEILFGARLRDYLIGHVIVPELLAKSKLSPSVIVADDLSAISCQTSLKYPLAVVDHLEELEEKQPCDETPATPGPSETFDQRGSLDRDLPEYLINWQRLTIGRDLNIIGSDSLDVRRFQLFAEQFCIREPFSRITDALTEAQSAAAA